MRKRHKIRAAGGFELVELGVWNVQLVDWVAAESLAGWAEGHAAARRAELLADDVVVVGRLVGWLVDHLLAVGEDSELLPEQHIVERYTAGQLVEKLGDLVLGLELQPVEQLGRQPAVLLELQLEQLRLLLGLDCQQ